jgi:hypothetical protein
MKVPVVLRHTGHSIAKFCLRFRKVIMDDCCGIIEIEVWYTQVSGNCKINAQVLSFHVWHFKEAEHLK